MAQRDPWAEASRGRTSTRWAEAAAGWNTALTDTLIAAAQIGPESVVVDLAAGSGDPSLEIARRIPSASVIALDRSSAGLALARESSQQQGFTSRMAFVQADVHAIPVKSASVDRITCKFGVMFFERTDSALSEMFRVLKPGGTVALLAWARFEQPFFEATLGTVLELMPGIRLPELTRAVHRFASPGSLTSEIRKAGFRNVQETEASLTRHWAGSPKQLWEYQQEVSTPWHPVFKAIPSNLRREIDSAVTAKLAQFRKADELVVPAEVILATGEK